MNNKHSFHGMHNGDNDSIACNVTECRHHSDDANYCTLEQINVVKHAATSSTVECTDCGSFERK